MAPAPTGTRMQRRALGKLGETAAQSLPKVNSELLQLTYGSLVAQLVKDYEDPAAINVQLEKMCERAVLAPLPLPLPLPPCTNRFQLDCEELPIASNWIDDSEHRQLGF
eukprot:SAG31_NODE_66_length_28567_cov_30.222698_1_plen_109_part_00